MPLVTTVLAALCSLVLAPPLHAQSSKKLALSCEPYRQLDRRCHCAGADNYLLSFGYKYCRRFLQTTGWTPAGLHWRNRTMVCLQQVLRQTSSGIAARTCDCGQVREFAFRSHVVCYTQAAASVCRLPPNDQSRIYANIDGSDFFSANGISQFLSIALTCVGQSAGRSFTIDNRKVN
jgi:hypothetical protein